MTMTDSNKAQATFKLCDSALASLTDDVFGLWQVTAAEELDFGSVHTAEAEKGQLWSVGLPSAPAAAADALAAREERMETVERDLGNLAGNLDEFVEVFEKIHYLPADDLAFDAARAARPWLAPEEARLWDALKSLSSGVRPAAWSQVTQEFRSLLGGLGRWISHFAWIETKSEAEAQLLARTVVDWTGDFDTRWWVDASSAQRALHRRSLALALSSRGALLHTFTLTAQTAAKLSTLAAVPGGLVLALPVVWRFVNKVLKEYQEYQALRNSL